MSLSKLQKDNVPAFHVVLRKFNDVPVTYAIYHNNVPYLEPNVAKVHAGTLPSLKKRRAYRICGILNALDGDDWPEPKKVKA